jgi:CHRD domain
MLKIFAAVAVLLTAFVYPGMAHADELFKATLTGDQEVPPVITDTTGKALLRLNQAETELEFQLHVNDGVRITQSHIHCAPVGVNGPIVVFLAGLHAAGLDVDGKWVSNATITDTGIVNTACGATLSALAESMRTGNTYVNVHSVANPGGVIRGQVEPAD